MALSDVEDDDEDEPKIGGVSYRSLFSHKPGERFIYDGGLFTRIVISDSLKLWLSCGGDEALNEKQIQNLRDSFLAVDQFGVLNIFSREENVVTVDVFPVWGGFYKTHPNGFPDANDILVDQNKRRVGLNYGN